MTSTLKVKNIEMGEGAASDSKILFDGNAQDFHIGLDDSADSLTIGLGSTLGTTSHMVIDANGHITKPLQSAFQARPSGAISNIASETVIAMSNEIFDQNSDYDTSTYTFTAPVTGRYFFSVAVRIDSLDTAANWQRITLDTSNHSYANSIIDLGGLSSDPNHWNISYAVLADMDASDTASIKWWQYGGSTQADISTSSYFSGYLVA